MTPLLAFILLLFLVPPVYGQGSYRELEKGLDLTETQRGKIDEARRQYIFEMRSIQQQAMVRRMELRQLQRHSAQSPEAERLRRELMELDLAQQRAYGRYQSQVSKSLTDRQRQQLDRFCDTERRRNIHRFRERGYEP